MARPAKVLTNRAIAVSAAVVVLVAVAAAWLLLDLYGAGSAADTARLDAIRTVGTIVLGAGGAIALLLAARRQQTAEQDLAEKRRDLVLKERIQNHAEDDSLARRITELYTSAVGQLGSDKAPVRMGGLYALERLAQDNEPQRQTIVNVLCAYLRMRDPDASKQEREVRLAAQRILAAHLQPDLSPDKFWADIDLDLTGAELVTFELQDAQVRKVDFTEAAFVGVARFVGTRFLGDAVFEGAGFAQGARFAGAEFGAGALFDLVTVDDRFDIGNAVFGGEATFVHASFAQHADFRSVVFSDAVSFSETSFAAGAEFDPVTRERIDFAGAIFPED